MFRASLVICGLVLPTVAFAADQAVLTIPPYPSGFTPPKVLHFGFWYPTMALQDHIEGTVCMLMTVGTDGTVSDVTVTASSGSKILDDAAISNAQQTTYAPADLNGNPIAVRMRKNAGFYLNRNPDPKLAETCSQPPAP